MKFRFDWGAGIVTAIVVIIAGLGTLVWIASRQDFDLVDKDYYQKGVQYQNHIEKIKNAEALAEKLSCSITGKTLRLKFPGNRELNPSGQVYFYSPANSDNDLKSPIRLNDSLWQDFDLNLLKSGRYLLKVDWTCDSVGYFQEFTIKID